MELAEHKSNRLIVRSLNMKLVLFVSGIISGMTLHAVHAQETPAPDESAQRTREEYERVKRYILYENARTRHSMRLLKDEMVGLESDWKKAANARINTKFSPDVEYTPSGIKQNYRVGKGFVFPDRDTRKAFVEKIKRDLEIRRQQLDRFESGNEKVRVPLEQFKVGNMGTVGSFDAKIQQVIDESSALVRFGSQDTDDSILVWVEGINTATTVDDQPVGFGHMVFLVVGTRQYTTVTGASNTIFVMRPLKIQKYREEVEEEIAEETPGSGLPEEPSSDEQIAKDRNEPRIGNPNRGSRPEDSPTQRDAPSEEK